MNNPRSVAYGWGVLTAAGIFAYCVAKKEIDESRKKYVEKQEILTWEQKVAKEEAKLANQPPTTTPASSNPSPASPPSSGPPPGTAPPPSS